MFDLKWIRECPDDFDAGLVRRRLEPHAKEVLALDQTRRETQTALQDLQARRNEAIFRDRVFNRGNDERDTLIGRVRDRGGVLIGPVKRGRNFFDRLFGR